MNFPDIRLSIIVMPLLCLLLLLSSGVWVTQVRGHPAPAVPVDGGHQAGHCDTFRSIFLSLQAALAETGDTCREVQASGEDHHNAILTV